MMASIEKPDVPSGADAQVENARILASRGDTLAALEIVDALLRAMPRHVPGLRMRAVLRVRMARYDEAIQDFDRLLEMEPGWAADYYDRAMAHLLANHEAQALADLGRCLALAPDFAPAYSARAGIHVRAGRYQAAQADINKALEIRPDHLGDLHNRAVVMTALGQYGQAIRDYQAVISKDPNSAGSYNNLAWLLVTAKDAAVRDGQEAVKYAQQAVNRSRNPAWLDTLAAAHAECGDFSRAVAIAKQAYRRSNPPNEKFRERLEIYRKHQTLANWLERRPEESAP